MRLPKWLFPLCFCLAQHFQLPAQEIREFMDLQTHPTMHMAYGFFGKGLAYFDAEAPPELSHKHLFTNVNYANFLEGNAGARIIVNGAILPEVMVPKKRARQRILEQLQFVNNFAAAHSEHFAVARSPQEVRDLIHQTDKTVIIHSIEGGKRLLDGPEDARFWADQGVAFITLIHLMDDEFGGAAILPDLTTKVINYRGGMRKTFRKRDSRGLTEKGKQAIQWLADAGIMTDLTHMSDQSRTDALAYMAAHNIPPLVTHDMFKPLHNHPRGIPEAEVVQIYQLGGMVSLPISGMSTQLHEADPKYEAEIAARERHCPGSIDSYIFSYEVVKELVESSAVEVALGPSKGFQQLSEAEKVDFAIGFQTDFNGWVNHHRPRYGEDGCLEVEPGKAYEAVELEGMAHPGLLESHWQLMEQEGADLEPIRRASEKFLQMWEYFLEHKQP